MARIEERLATLEAEIKQLEDKMHDVERELTYFRRIGIKTGALGICLLSLGAGTMMTVDKLKEKLADFIAWLLS